MSPIILCVEELSKLELYLLALARLRPYGARSGSEITDVLYFIVNSQKSALRADKSRSFAGLLVTYPFSLIP